MTDNCKDQKSEKLTDAEVQKQSDDKHLLRVGARVENLHRPRELIQIGCRAGIMIETQLRDPKSKVPALLESYDEVDQEANRLAHRRDIIKKKITRSREDNKELDNIHEDLTTAVSRRDWLGCKVFMVALTEFHQINLQRHFNLDFKL